MKNMLIRLFGIFFGLSLIASDYKGFNFPIGAGGLPVKLRACYVDNYPNDELDCKLGILFLNELIARIQRDAPEKNALVADLKKVRAEILLANIHNITEEDIDSLEKPL